MQLHLSVVGPLTSVLTVGILTYIYLIIQFQPNPVTLQHILNVIHILLVTQDSDEDLKRNFGLKQYM